MFYKLYERYMLFIGTAGQLVFYLQFFKILSDNSARDVSLTGFIFGLVSVASWLLYGIILKNRVLIISNAFAVIGASCVVTAILIYQ